MAGRKTHYYPYGRPLPITLIGVAEFLTLILWVVFSLRSWWIAIAIACAFILLLSAHEKHLHTYTRSGLAVPIERAEQEGFEPQKSATFPLLRRLGFFAIGFLSFLGVAPVGQQAAREGMISCIISVVICSLFYFFTWHYAVKSASDDALNGPPISQEK